MIISSILVIVTLNSGWRGKEKLNANHSEALMIEFPKRSPEVLRNEPKCFIFSSKGGKNQMFTSNYPAATLSFFVLNFRWLEPFSGCYQNEHKQLPLPFVTPLEASWHRSRDKCRHARYADPCRSCWLREDLQNWSHRTKARGSSSYQQISFSAGSSICSVKTECNARTLQKL